MCFAECQDIILVVGKIPMVKRNIILCTAIHR